MKYAIYKTPIGLRATEYADTKQGIADYPYIKESSLPVIINSVGGYTSFIEEYEKEKGFSHIVEVDDETYPLTREEMYPKNSDQFYWGWVSPDGDTYTCSYKGHAEAADFIAKELGYKGYSAENYLEELGWIKITRDTTCPRNQQSRCPLGQFEKLTKAAYETLQKLEGVADHYRIQRWGERKGYM